MIQIEDSERLFRCTNCGEMCQGYNAAHFWWDCGCGSKDIEEVSDEEYAERYPYKKEKQDEE